MFQFRITNRDIEHKAFRPTHALKNAHSLHALEIDDLETAAHAFFLNVNEALFMQ